MSFWTKIRDVVTAPIREIQDVSGGVWNKVLGRPSADEQRKQNQMAADQINAYRKQTELSRSQLDQARAATEAEKRRINEKQIRSLRRSNRAQGASLLGIGSSATPDMNNQLGG